MLDGDPVLRLYEGEWVLGFLVGWIEGSIGAVLGMRDGSKVLGKAVGIADGLIRTGCLVLGTVGLAVGFSTGALLSLACRRMVGSLV